MKKQDFINWSIESALRIGLVFLIILISFLIFKPFLVLIVWAAIIAIAFYPFYKKITKAFKGKKGLSASVLTLVLTGVLIVPTLFFMQALFESGETILHGVKQGTFHVTPPTESVKDWPLIGNKLYDFWQLSSTNLTAAILKMGPKLTKIGVWLFDSLGGLMGSVFIFFFALIIAGIFLTKADVAYSFSVSFAEKLVGINKGKQFIDNSKGTVQSVVKGVIGVAFIQTVLIGIGFEVAGVPAAPVLILIVFILAIVQVPAIIVVLPVIIYVFSVESTTVAVIFTIYELIAGLSDNVLKPMLLGRGVEIPMLVILIGSIGGMILMGMVGLFVGAVVLALAYQVFTSWMKPDNPDIETALN
jgi:predicted PurR-regulated permease PerM